MTAFTLSLSDFYELANMPKPDGRPDVAAIEELARREFAFVGSPLEITVEGDFVTVSFEDSAAVSEAERLAERAAKKAREGQYEKAISLWERVLTLHPSFRIARRDLAMTQFEHGNMEAAKDHLIEILRFNPKDAWSWVVLGNIYAKGKDDLEAAENHLRRALELTPDDPWALHSLAAVNMERGRTEEAIRLLRQAIASRPETANPYYGLAMTLHSLGRDGEAARTLRDMFAKAEQQDARSKPVFQNARGIYVTIEPTLAEAAHSENFKSVENFRAELEKRSGYPIRVVNADLPDKGGTLQDSLGQYAKKIEASARNRSAPYELAMKSHRNYQPGDQIKYYVTGTKKKVSSYENVKLASDWREDARDENVECYVAKLDELVKKYEEFLPTGTAGGDAGALGQGELF